MTCGEKMRDWAIAHGSGFLPRNLGLKMFTSMLPTLASCLKYEHPHILFDIGAGIHGIERFAMNAEKLHEDDSDALWMLRSFKNSSRIYAFEPNIIKAEQLRKAAMTRWYTKNFVNNMIVINKAVGSHNYRLPMQKCGAPNTWQVGLDTGCPKSKHEIDIVSLDSFVLTNIDVPILYVKVDVEGNKMKVLEGMTELLRNNKIQIASFEYAVGWNPLFNLRRPLSHGERLDAYNTSLFNFRRIADTFGYDAYLIHGSKKRITLLPISETYWHSDLEICFNRKMFYGNWGQWCWNDFLIVLRGGCIHASLENSVTVLNCM